LKKISTIIVFCAILVLPGCRSRFETTFSDRRSSAVEIDDSFTGERQAFQSRSVINFHLNSDQLLNAERISLSNQSTGMILFENQPLFDDNPPAVHLGYLIKTVDKDPTKPESSSPSSEITIKIFPLVAEFKDKFQYGANQLQLEIETLTGPRYIDREIVLHDFVAFGLGGTVSSTKRNRPLDGWFGGILRPVVKSKNTDHVLRAGFFHTVNH